MTAPSQNELDKAIEHHVDERHEWIRALVYCLRETSDGKPSFEDDVMTIDAHFEDHVLLKTEVFNQLLLTAKRSKELEKERDELRRGIITPTCSICNWTNINCLNLGEANGAPIWMCHGCIKRERDQLHTAYKQALKALKEIKFHDLRDSHVAGYCFVCEHIDKILSTPLAIETMKGEA